MHECNERQETSATNTDDRTMQWKDKRPAHGLPQQKSATIVVVAGGVKNVVKARGQTKKTVTEDKTVAF